MSLESFFRAFLRHQRPLLGHETVPNILALVAQSSRKLVPIKFTPNCRISEERSPARHSLQGFYLAALPWSLSSNIWADTLLSVASVRFVHVQSNSDDANG